MQNLEIQKKALANLFRQSKNSPQLMQLLEDLLTPAEIEKIYERVKIIDCLDQNLSQRKTLAKTGAAIATISRGAMLLQKHQVQLAKLVKISRKYTWWHTLFWCV